MEGFAIELAEGTSSELAAALRDAIADNLRRRPERITAFRRLDCRVLFRADDTEQAATLAFDGRRLVIHDGEAGQAPIRVLGDQQTILALTRLPLRHGLPDLLSEPGRLIVKRQLGGELTVRGLLLHAPRVRDLLAVLAAG